ncbi:MAG: DNA polymerase III subunit delta [bacterium]|nr:DNA polymerase III subunit delta [bacterium]
MVKIPKREIDGFCRAPGSAIRAVLIYGPDQGLVRERSNLLLGGAVDDPRDPFRVCDLTGEEAARDPARLMEEAVSLSMTGGRRVVRVRGMADSFAPTMAEVLKLPTGDTLILVEAAELAARSKLRAAFEKGKDTAALACYRDEGRDLEAVIADELSRQGIAADGNARRLLVSCLGGDRMQTRNEIAKLALYVGAGQRATARDVENAVADSSFLSLERIAHNVSSGNLDDLDRSLERALANRETPDTILGAVRRHLTQLELVLGLKERGVNEAQAMKAAGVVHFRAEDALKAAGRRWNAHLVHRARNYLFDAEAQCRTTGMPDATICRRALFDITRAAAGSASRRH